MWKISDIGIGVLAFKTSSSTSSLQSGGEVLVNPLWTCFSSVRFRDLPFVGLGEV